MGNSFRDVAKALLPGMFLVDYIPLLKHVPAWVPGAGFQNVAKRCKDLCRAMVDKPFEATVQHMVRPVCLCRVTRYYPSHLDNQASGTAKTSFLTNALENLDDATNVESLAVIKDVAAGLFLGIAVYLVSSFGPQCQLLTGNMFGSWCRYYCGQHSNILPCDGQLSRRTTQGSGGARPRASRTSTSAQRRGRPTIHLRNRERDHALETRSTIRYVYSDCIYMRTISQPISPRFRCFSFCD